TVSADTTWWLRQAGARAMPNQSTTSRGPTDGHERLVKLGRAASRLQIRLGREATREELAKESGLSLRHVEEALDAADAPVSLNQSVGAGDDGGRGDGAGDPTAAGPAGGGAGGGRREWVAAGGEE